MRTIQDASPYQVSMAMRISRADALTMTRGAETHTRDVFGETVTYNGAARTLTTHVQNDENGMI